MRPGQTHREETQRGELFLALVLIGHDSLLQAHDESLPNHIHHFLSLLVCECMLLRLFSCTVAAVFMHICSPFLLSS